MAMRAGIIGIGSHLLQAFGRAHRRRRRWSEGGGAPEPARRDAEC